MYKLPFLQQDAAAPAPLRALGHITQTGLSIYYIYIYIYIYILVYMHKHICISACIYEGGREGVKEEMSEGVK